MIEQASFGFEQTGIYFSPDHRDAGTEGLISHNEEVAWIFGVLTGKGSIDIKSNRIRFSYSENTDSQYIQRIEEIIERQFNLHGNHLSQATGRNPDAKLLLFNSDRNLINAIGTFRRQKWLETIQYQHNWILEDEEFSWKFINGMFDSRGGISLSRPRIRFSLGPSAKCAFFLQKLFESLGVQNPKIISQERTENPHIHDYLIYINNLKDTIFMAQNIESVKESNKNILEHYRNWTSQGRLLKIFSYEDAHLPEESPSLDKDVLLEPSDELAWILGVLSGGGSVGPKRVRIVSENKLELLDKFQSIGKQLFQINSSRRTSTRRAGAAYESVEFFSSSLSQVLGDMKTDQWPSTVSERHPWLTRNKRYMWKFIEGFMEMNGGISKKSKQISLYATDENAVGFLTSMLQHLGIEKIYQAYNKKNNTYQRVYISRGNDLSLLANNIESTTPEREKDLDYFRGIQPTKHRANRSDETKVIKEYRRIKTFLDRIPSSHEINILKKKGETQFSVNVYRNLFGEGSWKIAVYRLETILSQIDTEGDTII